MTGISIRASKRGISLLATVLFSAGILLGLTISAGVTWAEIEALLYASHALVDRLTTVRCPLALSSAGTGSVEATFVNPSSESSEFTVEIELSQQNGTSRNISTFFTLEPGEKRSQLWTVGREEMIWGRVILVSIYETHPANLVNVLPSRQGSCGILILGSGKMGGERAVHWLFFLAITCLLTGAALGMYNRRPLTGVKISAGIASAILAILVLFSLFTAITRWWGLSLFFMTLSLLMIVVIITEFLLFSSEAKRLYTDW